MRHVIVMLRVSTVSGCMCRLPGQRHFRRHRSSSIFLPRFLSSDAAFFLPLAFSFTSCMYSATRFSSPYLPFLPRQPVSASYCTLRSISVIFAKIAAEIIDERFIDAYVKRRQVIEIPPSPGFERYADRTCPPQLQPSLPSTGERLPLFAMMPFRFHGFCYRASEKTRRHAERHCFAYSHYRPLQYSNIYGKHIRASPYFAFIISGFPSLQALLTPPFSS